MPIFKVKDADGKITSIIGESAAQVVDLNKKMGITVEIVEEVPVATFDKSHAQRGELGGFLPDLPPPPPPPPPPPVFFSEAGIDFKLAGGKLFKATWVDVDTLKDQDSADYRIEFEDDDIDQSKVHLMKKTWVEIQSVRTTNEKTFK